MFPQQPQQQFRTAGADVKLFYGAGDNVSISQYSWIKPPGVSHVYMLLIGGGGNGDQSTAGGGGGAVTVWYGAAQNVPNSLIVTVSTGNAVNTTISYSGKSTITLLTANAGNNTTQGAVSTANQFANSGFFQSVAGQAASTGSRTASATTFLSGGAGNGGSVAANYGYATSSNGFFLLQPLIVGVGGSGVSTPAWVGGVGCGGGYLGKGGPGLVIIASW